MIFIFHHHQILHNRQQAEEDSDHWENSSNCPSLVPRASIPQHRKRKQSPLVLLRCQMAQEFREAKVVRICGAKYQKTGL